MATPEKQQEARDSLSRMQQFDVETLSRVDDLGKQMGFQDSIESAQALISVYQRVSLDSLADFADQQLDAIKNLANSDFQIFEQVLTFDATQQNAADVRKNLIDKIAKRRDEAFQQLWQYIAYSVARVTDTGVVEAEARATIQGIKDKAKEITDSLAITKGAADETLSAIKKVAAEQGVSQKAIYFRDEATVQETKAEEWLKLSYWLALALGFVAIAGLFLHRWEWLAPKSEVEAIQFIASKILIFAVLAYMLIMAVRNYNAYKHNAVVNRHRQNALLTYTTLAKAAENQGTTDIVLANAASCIFAPQETGFSAGKSQDSGIGSKSVLELMTKSSAKASD